MGPSIKSSIRGPEALIHENSGVTELFCSTAAAPRTPWVRVGRHRYSRLALRSWRFGLRVGARAERQRQRRAQVRFSLREPALQRVLLIDHGRKRFFARLELMRGIEQRLLDVGQQRAALAPHAVLQSRGARRAVTRRDGRARAAIVLGRVIRIGRRHGRIRQRVNVMRACIR